MVCSGGELFNHKSGNLNCDEVGNKRDGDSGGSGGCGSDRVFGGGERWWWW